MSKTKAVHEDPALLARVRALDPDALAEVHDTYYAPIYRYIAYRVQGRQIAEDLTSEVFIRLLTALQDAHAPQRTLRGWLYGVASRVVSDHHRRHYRVRETPLNESMAGQRPDPADTIAAKLAREHLLAAIEELTEDQQTVLALRFGYEMPIREVANTLGKSIGAIKQLQARAVAALARRMVEERSG